MNQVLFLLSTKPLVVHSDVFARRSFRFQTIFSSKKRSIPSFRNVAHQTKDRLSTLFNMAAHPTNADCIPENKSTTSNHTSDSSLTAHAYSETPSFRDCLAFALPALGIYACPPLMSLIDAAFIGRVSTVELAALGPASSISDSAPLPLFFLSIASTNLIAKAFAKKDQETLVRVSRTALGMGAICGLILALVMLILVHPISVMYCGKSAALLATPCTKYVAIRTLVLPFVVVTTIAQAISIGTKDSRTPMISVALAGLLNLAGDLVLVQWLGQGIAGAAWATAISQVLAAFLLLRVLKKRGFIGQDRQQIPAGQDKETTTTTTTSHSKVSTMTTICQLLSFIPFLFVMSVKIFWHNACSSTAASLSPVHAAAHTALLSVSMLCFLFGDAGSSLAQAFLPAFLQTKSTTSEHSNRATVGSVSSEPSFDMDAAMPTIKQLLKTTLSISTAAVILACTIIGIFGNQITGDPSVLVEMRKTLPWIATALSFHGTAVAMEGLLLVRKKFRFLTICYTLLAISVTAFQIATKHFHLGLAGVWGCYVWFCASRVLTFSMFGGLLRPRQWFQRWSKGWRSKQIKVTDVNSRMEPFPHVL